LTRSSPSRSTTGSQTASTFGASTFGESSTRRLALWLSFLFLSAVLVAGGIIYFRTQHSIREIADDQLHWILSANVSALELWLGDQESMAGRMLSRFDDRTSLAAWLGQSSGSDPEVANQITRHFDAQVLDVRRDGDCLGWIILDDQAHIRAASDPRWIGQPLEPALPALEASYRRGATVTPPVWLPADADPKQASMIALSPIREGVLPVGGFGLLLDPAGRFTELLSVARSGNSGETYAFNEEGVMISRSRFEDQLRDLGLLDGDGEDGDSERDSVLRIRIRDPGLRLVAVDEATRKETLKGLSGLPPTRMIRSACNGQSASDVLGYNDYRGVPVIGAWRWLDEHGIGVATEMDVDEVYRPLRILQSSMWWLFGLLTMASAGLAVLSFAAGRLMNRAYALQSNIRRLGQYELFEIIGRGGMGTVYRGRHELLSRDVAVKVLERVDQDDQVIPLADERAIERFEREVQVTAVLRHPNTIAVYDFGRTNEGTFFYVMEHVDGINLRKLVKQDGAQSPARVIHLLVQLCGSIAEAHDHGLIHRDIKPGNILVTNHSGLYDMVKVLDFGLVRRLENDQQTLTTPTALTGTPMYMAPEIIRDSNLAGPASDIYAIGAVGYQLLTGCPPYDVTSAAEICALRLGGDPVRPSDRVGKELPEDLQNILMSCLRTDPEDRPATATELAESLRCCRDSLTWTESDAKTWWRRQTQAPIIPPMSLDAFRSKAEDSGSSAPPTGPVDESLTEGATDVTVSFDARGSAELGRIDDDPNVRKLT